MNPYQNSDPVETVDAERTVIIDPVTGEQVTIGARIERLRIDERGEHREVLHVVVPSADGKQLLFPYKEALYACSVCGAKPLVQARQCARCGGFVCLGHLDPERGLCAQCAHESWWVKAVKWLIEL